MSKTSGGKKNVGGKKINKKMQLFPRNILN